MSRALCQQCQRPKNACICAFAVRIDNDIPVIVLQHPNEVSQSKGTVSLLKQSLTQCEVMVGENFDDSPILLQRLKQYKDNIVLLYPSEQAITLDYSTIVNNESTVNGTIDHKLENLVEDLFEKIATRDNSQALISCEKNDIKCIIILDGTWKKAYRMYMLSLCLHKIKHIVLPAGITSLYQIRKTKKDNALSSLEACCHALARIENKPEKYQALLSGFVKFNQFQQSFSRINPLIKKRINADV